MNKMRCGACRESWEGEVVDERCPTCVAAGRFGDDRLDLWPTAIIEDRYGGTYSGGKWVAVADFERCDFGDASQSRLAAAVDGTLAGDGECMRFWHEHADTPWIAAGDTPNEACAALWAKNPERAR